LLHYYSLWKSFWSGGTKQRGESSKNTNNYRFLNDRTLWCEPTSSSILCKKSCSSDSTSFFVSIVGPPVMLVYHVNARLKFEVFMAINITIKVLWNVSPCRLVSKCHCFGGTKYLIFGLHIAEDGNFKGFLFVFFLIYLCACVFLPFLFYLLFFFLTYFWFSFLFNRQFMALRLADGP